MKTVKISIKTPWDKELIAEMKAQKTSKTAIINKMLAEKFGPASSAPETLTPDKCCLACVYEKCESGICPHDHATRDAGEEAGACGPCELCPDHTAKPKEEK